MIYFSFDTKLSERKMFFSETLVDQIYNTALYRYHTIGMYWYVYTMYTMKVQYSLYVAQSKNIWGYRSISLPFLS
jgi:hypothetical protein